MISSKANTLKQLILVALLLPVLLSTLTSRANERLQLWTYYTFAPFTTDVKLEQGLSYDFAALLNKQSEELHFFARYIPRPRINQSLKRGDDAIILWVNPIWFGDEAKELYQWTPPIIYDRNEVISRIEDRLDYKGPTSLFGKRFGVTRGHKYKDLEKYIDAGVILSEEANREESNLMKLVAKRIDFTIMPASGASYLINTLKMQSKLYFSNTPHQSYTRHILVRYNDKAKQERILNIISRALKSDEWRALLNSYSLTKSNGFDNKKAGVK